MAWDDARFERFVEATIRMAQHQLPGYGYPHVILPYPPKEELTCIEAVRNLPGRLKQVGLAAEAVALAPYVARALARYSRRPLNDADDYQRLQADLSEPRNGLIGRTLDACVPELVTKVADGKTLALCRLGALYPFGHVSALLEGLYSRGVTTTLAVVYPGSADGTALSFLGRLDPTGAYRGHIVT
jgi:hypothetical protein